MLTENSPYIDLVFSLTGQNLPLDNGYIVYSALSRICPAIHQLENLSIHPIAGIPESSKQLRLTQRSKLQIRLPIDLIPFIYEFLAGQTFSIGQNQFHLGIPEYNPLHPFPDLYSRLVIIRRFQEPQSFLEAAKRQLESLNIQGTITLATRANGQPQCRQLTIENQNGTFVVRGFGVQATDLNPEDSITLQKYGIGGKQKMMCGVFVPSRRDKRERE
ncbi:type I-MYXAN CRISPR-associated protein Cas6/Cmx6 [Coleofasciculus sp. FACHB-129]|uniref:type I-MYXAN CRISPR-associated protein Cas6/Cmx6 n=1 Tax=Cyanophyceae TaxID=3028117 RepID=UPI0016879678|nr:type I-MYXAN CRISPR-associated protein Cas6/Cmx6 [Coleofasciculus sp. FACHB-129]MBD1897923.1 type I-MYXAN CRISPR-associated protein Cas6/Cmx6 [Coleofasciculus sp. FACHB-129]